MRDLVTATLTFYVAMTNLLPSSARAQDQQPSPGIRLAEILRPYVKSLDRDLWTFRYEAKDSFQPHSQADLQKRIGPWADRFWKVDIISGADTGPGVYVAMDPAATATWGLEFPRMYAIKIKRGVNVLVGDQSKTPRYVEEKARHLATDLSCTQSSTALQEDLGHLVGYFRMNQNATCRQAAIDALRTLEVKALSYSFYSAPLEHCRTTGTAISIIDSAAISLEELNRYSDDGNIEGQPNVTPFVHRLFNEAKSDYVSQSLLWSLKVRENYNSAYGYFENVPDANESEFRNWKERHVLKCGARWNIETENNKALFFMVEKTKADPEVKELLLSMALIFRDKFRATLLSSVIELNIGRVPKIRAAFSTNRVNFFRFLTAQVPVQTGRPEQDKHTYLQLLKECLSIYENQSPAEISKSECRVEPRLKVNPAPAPRPY